MSHSKAKDITELLSDLQSKAQKADQYEEIFNRFCKTEFGFSIPQIHAMLDKQIAYEAKVKQAREQQQFRQTQSGGQQE